MAKRVTELLLRIRWDDEQVDHPMGWDWRTLVEGDPFSREGSHDVNVASFTDINMDDQPEQV